MKENGNGPGLAESQAGFEPGQGQASQDGNGNQATPPAPSIFISHRHADFALAGILRDFIEQRAPNAEVFQSTYEGGGSSIGKLLSEDLGKRLSAAEVVLLLYTTADENWSYCMWEVGVAFNPECEDTRIIVLQAGADVPAPLGARRAVRLASETDVMQFVAQLFTDATLFPKHGSALWPKRTADGDVVKRIGADLWGKLLEYGIKEDADKDWHICRTIVLATTTVFEAEMCAQLQGLTSSPASPERRQEVAELQRRLAENLHVETAPRGSGEIFGLHVKPETRFAEMVEAWREERDAEPVWVDMLLEQILRAVEGKWPRSRYHALRHATDDHAYLPMLELVRRLPAAGRVEYHIILPRFDLDGAGETIALPLSG